MAKSITRDLKRNNWHTHECTMPTQFHCVLPEFSHTCRSSAYPTPWTNNSQVKWKFLYAHANNNLMEHLSSKTDDSTTSHLRHQTSWWHHLSSINLYRAHLGPPHLCGLILLVSGQRSKIFELIHFPLMPPSVSAKYCDRNKQTFIVLSDDPLNNQSPLVHNVHTGPWRTTRTKKRIYRS